MKKNSNPAGISDPNGVSKQYTLSLPLPNLTLPKQIDTNKKQRKGEHNECLSPNFQF